MTDFLTIRKNITAKVDISDKEFEFFTSKLRHHYFDKKNFLLRQGDVCKYFSYIIKGAARSYIVNDKGEEKTISLGIEDWWMNELTSFWTKTPSRVNIVAVEDCELLQITYDDLEEVMDFSPAFSKFIRVSAMASFAASQNRLMDILSNTIDNRYITFIEKYPLFFQRFPQYVIASYLNVTPEHLSATRSKISKTTTK